MRRREPSIRRAAVLAVAFALAAGRPAVPAPSFDCARAKTATEQLICGDAILADLDQRLAETYRTLQEQMDDAAKRRLLREQRAWLGERGTRCGIPNEAATPMPAQTWQWAPCLAERYRERLARLGVAVEPPVQPAAARQPDFVHPLCLDLALGGRAGEGAGGEQPGPVLLAACDRGHRHVPVTTRADQPGWLVAEGTAAGAPTWIGYRPIGKLADGRTIVQVDWNGGGTGTFSEIAELRQAHAEGAGAATLTARTVLGGGDRCNGGIDSARLDGTAVETAFRATPAALIAGGDPKLDVARYGLYDCAICCAGSVRHRYDLQTGTDAVIGATIAESLGTDGGDADGAQACFDRLVKEGRGPLPQALSAAELTELARRFVAACPAGDAQ